MEDLETYERVIFRDLFSTESSLNVFHFHEKYQLSPAQIYAFTNEYQPKGFVTMIEETISLTTEGKKYIWANRFSIFEKSLKRSWRPTKEPKNWNEQTNLDFLAPHYKHLDKRLINLNKENFLNILLRRNNGTDSQA